MKKYFSLIVCLFSLALMFAFAATFQPAMQTSPENTAALQYQDGKEAMMFGAFMTAAVAMFLILVPAFYVISRLGSKRPTQDQEAKILMEKYDL